MQLAPACARHRCRACHTLMARLRTVTNGDENLRVGYQYLTPEARKGLMVRAKDAFGPELKKQLSETVTESSKRTDGLMMLVLLMLLLLLLLLRSHFGSRQVLGSRQGKSLAQGKGTFISTNLL